MKNIAIFASGEGTNAENIIRYFEQDDVIKVSIVLTDQKNANVLKRAAKLNVPTRIFSNHEFYQTDQILSILKELKIDLIVLAGFLKLVPSLFINEFKGQIINIHPALLPKFGGKGMYGLNVHQAVYDSKEPESGITIHHVNEKFDDGKIIFQKKFTISDTDTLASISKKVRELELEYYPKIIETLLKK